MELKKIIFIRHGDYDQSGKINSIGVSKINELIPHIKDNIGESEKVIILSSSSTRAESSIKIISESLNIPYEISDLLRCDDRSADFIKASKFIDNAAQDKEVAIIMTHTEYTDFLPSFLFIFWKIQSFINRNYEIEKGEMLILDFEEKYLEFIP